MQFGVTGARYPTTRTEPLVIDIRMSQIRTMIAKAQEDGFGFGRNPARPGRMSLDEAFEALKAGELDVDHPESPIRFPRAAERGDAIDQNPALEGRPLLVVEDAFGHRMVCDMSVEAPRAPAPRYEEIEESSEYQHHRGSGHYEEDQYVEVESSRPPRVTIHEVDDDFDPRDLEGGQPMPRRREELPEDDMPPMPRGRGDEPRFDERFDRLQPEMRVQGEPRAERVDGAARAQKADQAEAAGADAAAKPLKIGRVTIDKADMAEIKAIAKELGIEPKFAAKCLRAPTSDERLLARGPAKVSLARDVEVRERIVVLDPNDKHEYAVISLSPKKPSYANLLSAGLHTVSMVPGFGGLAQSAGGALTFAAGVAGSLIGPLAKQEHNLNLMRTGIKHALWGVANAFIDFTSAGAAWLFRAVPGAVAAGTDVTQFFKNKPDGQAGYVKVMPGQKPTGLQRFGGLLDTAVDMFATAIKR